MVESFSHKEMVGSSTLPTETRFCTECGAQLSGRQRKHCSKTCQNRKYNPLYQNYKKQQARGINRKIELIKIKGRGCIKCGYNKNIAALVFHHKYDKKFTLDTRKLANGSMEEILAEAEKCDLMCHNCHAELHNPQGFININDFMLE